MSTRCRNFVACGVHTAYGVVEIIISADGFSVYGSYEVAGFEVGIVDIAVFGYAGNVYSLEVLAL